MQTILVILKLLNQFSRCLSFVFLLSQVVGPPGTGKTDVAVQIISNIYHNFPEQRTLLVTHSNQVKSCNVMAKTIYT